MKKAIFFAVLCLFALGLYIARVDLAQKVMPIVTSGYGVHIDVLEINRLDIDNIAIETINFKYQGDSAEILFDVSDATADFVVSFDKQQKISNVFVGYMAIDIKVSDVKQSEQAADKSVETLKSYIELLPLYGVHVDHLEVEYFENDVLLAKYSGELKYKDDFDLNGKFSYASFESDIDLSVSDATVKLTLSDENNEIVNLQGGYDLNNDWLLLDARSHYDLKEVQNFFGDGEGDWSVQALEGRLDFAIEIDLLQTLDEVLGTVALNVNLDTSINFSSDSYKIKQGLADLRMQCMLVSMVLENCAMNQPQKLMLELDETPKKIAEYINKDIDTYYLEINPNNLVEFNYSVGKNSGLTVSGDAKLSLYPEYSDFNLNADLLNIDFRLDDERWLLVNDYSLGFNVENLTDSLIVESLGIDVNGKLKADSRKVTINTDKGASLALLGVEYQDSSVDVVQAYQKNDAEIIYHLQENILQAKQHKFSIISKGVQYDDVAFTVDAAEFDIHDYQLSQDQQSLNAQLSIGGLEVNKKSLKIQSSDWDAKIKVAANRLNVDGNFLLGVKNIPLEFVISDDMAVGSGDMQFESLSIPLSNNEVIAQIIGVTGFPLQLKDGGVALSGALNWDDAYQNTRVVVNLSAKDVSGDYAQNLFDNLNVDMTLEENSGWVLLVPATLTIEEVNVGVPLRDVTMRIEEYQYGVQAQPAFKVVDFFAAALDGSIYSNAIDIDLNKTSNEFSIYLSNLSLEKLIELNQTQDLFATGIVNGELPMSLNDGALKIDNGWMQADERGGVIKYGRVKDVLSGNEDLKLVAQLLEDFQYNEMSAVVNLSPDGGLTLNTKLHGKSPDAEFNTPVNLNFNIDLNLWKLLESARLLTRIGQDITEQVSMPGKESK